MNLIICLISFLTYFLLIPPNILGQVEFKNINLNQATKTAQESSKKILVYFYTIPCPACTLLTRQIFEDSEMAKFINSNFICLKLRGDKTYKKDDAYNSLIKEYEIKRGFPVVLLLNSDGKFIDVIRGFGDKESYSQTLRNYTNNLNTFSYYQNRIENNTEDCEAMVQLAMKYHDLYKRDKAFKLYESAVRYSPCKKDALTWFALSRYYKHYGMINKAIFACEIAIELDPENSQFQNVLNMLKESGKE
jgi:thioredoxin-related protein